MRRKWFTPLAAFALAGGSMLAATGAASAAAAPSSQHAGVPPGGVAWHVVTPFGTSGHTAAQSNNWSGYVAHGSAGQFTSVSANWTEPAARCRPGEQYSWFMVGLDGWSRSSRTVEETGIQAACYRSRSYYSAMWEMYPGGTHSFSSPVRPGDQVSASVTYAGGSSYILKISDSTERWSHTLYESLSATERSSAEVLVEAPCCTRTGGILPLTDFGKVSFSQAKVNGSPLGNASPTKVVMWSRTTRKDSISPLSGGTSFTATWLHQ